MRKTLTAAAALVALAAGFAAVAAGGTHSTAQRVRIEAKGAGSTFAFVLRPMSHGRVQRDAGPLGFCCWSSWDVTRAGARVEVTNPLLTLVGKQGTLRIRDQVEWAPLPDGWSVFAGTWKVVGGTGAYAGFSGHGRVAGVWAADGDIKLRLFGFLESK